MDHKREGDCIRKLKVGLSGAQGRVLTIAAETDEAMGKLRGIGLGRPQAHPGRIIIPRLEGGANLKIYTRDDMTEYMSKGWSTARLNGHEPGFEEMAPFSKMECVAELTEDDLYISVDWRAEPRVRVPDDDGLIHVQVDNERFTIPASHRTSLIRRLVELERP